MTNILFWVMASIATSLTFQPQTVPVVGEPLPEFTLSNVHYYKDKNVSHDSFRGKWLLLQFWSLSCSASIESLDQAYSIQAMYGSELQVLLVGHNHGAMNDGIEKVFERKRETKGFDLPVVYDTLLFEKWALRGVPVIYIVNPDGILRYISSGSDLTLSKVGDLIRGKDISLRSLEFEYKHLDDNKLFSKQINYDDVMYLSVLTKWSGEYPSLGYEFDRFVQLPDEFKASGWSVKFATLTRLYQYAYYGQGWFYMRDSAYYGEIFEKPVLEVKDKTPFTFQDFQKGVGYYNYYLRLHPALFNKELMMHEMQHILDKNFGYRSAIETRPMPVWRLEADGQAFNILKSKGGEPTFFGIHPVAGVKVRNYAIKDFLRLVTANLRNDDRIPYLDYTGIHFGIDASIQTDMTDFDSVQKALNQYGLKLVKGLKEMKVLVIRDN